jgi:hypothetical protein
MPHFALVTADGESLGAIQLGRPDWPTGSVIYRGNREPDLRVLDMRPGDGPERGTVLVVEPLIGR